MPADCADTIDFTLRTTILGKESFWQDIRVVLAVSRKRSMRLKLYKTIKNVACYVPVWISLLCHVTGIPQALHSKPQIAWSHCRSRSKG